MKQKTIIKSSEKLAKFLEKENLHKKDFAQMIGVTLSYVYNLIDETIPFSTRSTTLERIATVMEIEPEDFEEYQIPQEPIYLDDTIIKIKSLLKTKKIKVIDFLKSFPRNKRLDIVDILRGALPIPLDYQELNNICSLLKMNKNEVFNIWKVRFTRVLEHNGMNIYSNAEFLNNLLNCAEKFLLKS